MEATGFADLGHTQCLLDGLLTGVDGLGDGLTTRSAAMNSWTSGLTRSQDQRCVREAVERLRLGDDRAVLLGDRDRIEFRGDLPRPRGFPRFREGGVPD